MYKASSLVAAGLAAVRLANAQIPLPAITGAGQGSNGDCGGCYVVADVAGIAFGSEINTATATNQVIVQNGMNSTFTTTSLIFEQGQFTFAPMTNAPHTNAAASPQASPLNVGTSTLAVSGVTLTSPTAYNVFTAYSITSYEATNGGCRIVAGPATKLPSAFSVAIPSGVDYGSFAGEAQSSFINFLGVPTCSAGGENLTPTAIIPQTVTTVSATTTSRATLTPQPAVVSPTARSTSGGPTAPTTRASAAASSQTSAAFSTFIPGSLPNGTSTATLRGGTGTIFIPGASGRGTNSIAIAGADRSRSTGSWLIGAAALVMGFVA